MAKSKQAVIQVDTGPAQKSLNDLRKQITETKSALYQLTEGTQEYNDKLQELGYAQDELSGFMAKTRQGCTALEGSYNALSYQMGILKQQYHETNEEAKRSELATQINAINDKLKEMDEAVGNHSRNVGNYTKSMTEAFQNVGLTIGNINPLFANLANGMMSAGEKGGTAFANLGTAAKSLGSQLKALAANPVGAVIMAIVIAVKAAKAIFDKFRESVNRNEEAQNNLKKAMAPIQSIVNGITNAFDSFVEVLTAGAAAIGEFVGAVMKWMGLNDERVKAEEDIAQMEIDNAKLKRQYIEENARLDMEASEARAKASEKDKYTNKERIAFLQEYKDKQDQIAKNNLDMAEKELALLEEQAAQGKNDAAMNDKIAEAKAKVYQVQQAYNDKLRETNAQMAELNNQIKAEEEATKKANEEKAKKWAEEIKRLKEEYKGLITTFEDAMMGDDVEYQISKLTKQQAEYAKQLANEYKKGAITKKEYDQAVYKSENWLYQETTKLRQQESDAREAAIQHYNDLVQDSTQKTIEAILRERDAEIAALQDIGLTPEEIDQMTKNITSVYASKLQKAKNELYVKDVQERMSIELAGDDLIYQNKEAMLKNDLSNRKISLQEYIQQSIDLEIESMRSQVAIEEQKQAEFQVLYEEGKISLEAYTESMMASQTMVLDLQTQINARLTEQKDILIDGTVQSLAALTDFMTGYISEIASVGDGISSEWSTVFGKVGDSITAIGDALKDNGKGWQKWAKVAGAAMDAASSMMLAMADEQDAQTKEGFEKQKKYQIAAVTLNMLSGIMGAVTSAMDPANAWMTAIGQGIMAGVMSAMVAGIGIAQIVKIQQTQFNGSSSASSSGASVSPNTSALSNIQAPVQWSSAVEGASTEGKVKDTRVYVVQSDIADTNRAVSVEESENRY